MPEETDVRITTQDPPIRGHVIGPAGPPRSYILHILTGQVHRNRHHLHIVPESLNIQEHQNNSAEMPAEDSPTHNHPTPPKNSHDPLAHGNCNPVARQGDVAQVIVTPYDYCMPFPDYHLSSLWSTIVSCYYLPE